MVELSNISKIGYGCYRTSVKDENHLQSLSFALQMGCNLIDTASNYLQGESEELVGYLHKSVKPDQTFVVTKAGYATNQDLAYLNSQLAQGKAVDGTCTLDATFKHSINPDYLRRQLERSLHRVGKSQIDCFLLHNPEYYFKSIDKLPKAENFYANITRAFEFLEDMVQAGKIRYYGISSTALPGNAASPNKIDLYRLHSCASQIAAAPHFRFIQFPFNILENTATTEVHNHNRSLVASAKALELLTLANRPLNANSPRGAVRLATYPVDEALLVRADDALAQAAHAINRQLKRIGREEQATDYPIFEAIHQHLRSLTSFKLFDVVFLDRFLAFLDSLYEGPVPTSDVPIYRLLTDCGREFTKLNVNTNSEQLKDALLRTGQISSPHRSLQSNVCQAYLDAGLDHVLVGMRSREYVQELKYLF